MRYNKTIYFPDINELKIFTHNLNFLSWKYTMHCVDKIKKSLDLYEIETLFNFIKKVVLKEEEIFEYYKDETRGIYKVCYRIKYTINMDIILVLGDKKEIVTIWINKKDDVHKTLKRKLYAIC